MDEAMPGLTLSLIGIGTGNPDHVTCQGAAAIREADLILVPRKGADKGDLADLRHQIIARVCADAAPPPVVEFDLPQRASRGDYLANVDAWHDAIATVWAQTIEAAGKPRRVALLIWGDPSLYDSSLRIAARLSPAPGIEVVPGITALQALTAAHAIPINEIGAPFQVTTGRRLRDEGWPAGVARVAVMLDGGCAFQSLPGDAYHIWWGAYLGMADQIIDAGPLDEATPRILQARAAAREAHGWIMDCYLLQKIR